MKSFSELIKSSTPVLVDFYADWCGPCKMMAPVLKQVKSKLNDKVNIIKVDVDKNQTASLEYKISSVPTLMIFKNGNLLWRQSGVASEQQLIQLLQEHV